MRNYTVKELYSYAPEVKPILPGLFFERDGVILAGYSGVGKSIFVQNLIKSLVTGEEFLSYLAPTKQYNVAYVFTEGGLSYVKGRFQKMGLDDSNKNLLIVDFQEDKLVEASERLVQDFRLRRFNPDVIVIDSLYNSFTGTLMSDVAVGDYRRELDKLRNLYNCMMILTHHFTKEQRNLMGEVQRRRADDVYGSVLWSAWPTTMFVLEQKDGKHLLRCGKDRDNLVEDKEMELELKEEPLGFERVG